MSSALKTTSEEHFVNIEIDIVKLEIKLYSQDDALRRFLNYTNKILLRTFFFGSNTIRTLFRNLNKSCKLKIALDNWETF